MANHYVTLGVWRDASQRDVVQAYRRLARLTHPDGGGPRANAPAFIAVRSAYDVLGDPARRARYDLELDREAGARAPAPPPPPRPSRPSPPRSRFVPPAAPPPPDDDGATATALAASALLLVVAPVPFAGAHAGAALVAILAGVVAACVSRRLARSEQRRLWGWRFQVSAGMLRAGDELVLRAAWAERRVALAGAAAAFVPGIAFLAAAAVLVLAAG